jgi:quercetin dioxygenase-like cupin family protein
MARAGDIIENQITGERILFTKTASDTNGEYLEMEFFVRPGGFVAAEHIHSFEDETFEVLSGTITMSVQGQKTVGTSGFKHTVKAGVPHIWVNSGSDELHARVTLSPAHEMDHFFEVLFGLAAGGKASDKGLPNMIHLALLGIRHKMWLAGPPIAVQSLLFHILKPVGILLGYTKLHRKYIK